MENKLTIYYKKNDGGGSSDSGGSSAGAPRTDANGVMGLGWYEENGKTYYLQDNIRHYKYFGKGKKQYEKNFESSFIKFVNSIFICMRN